jgi:hypothetical protein
MTRSVVALMAAIGCFGAENTFTDPLLQVRRIFVDDLNGTSAPQIRDMLINALQSSKLFIITENKEKADAFLRGSAEDLIFTDTFQSSEGIQARGSIGASGRTTASRIPAVAVSVGEQESTRIAERKHEATAAVRLVSRDGEVIWATTQESMGAKFRGAGADVADKIVKQLLADIEKARRIEPPPAPVQ